jgi:ABC-2 type transport system permease protein
MVVLTFNWSDLILTIRTGEVVSDLSKPCDFYWYWFSREIGRSAYYFVFRSIPTYAAGALLFGLGMPGEWHAWLAYSLALPLGAMLGIAYRYLYNIAAFWMIEARAIVTMATVIALFFTGSYIPIPFLPDWLRTLADWLPFSGLMNLPAQMLMNKLSGSALWLALGNQVLWLVALTSVARLLTTLAARRVVIQGG